MCCDLIPRKFFVDQSNVLISQSITIERKTVYNSNLRHSILISFARQLNSWLPCHFFWDICTFFGIHLHPKHGRTLQLQTWGSDLRDLRLLWHSHPVHALQSALCTTRCDTHTLCICNTPSISYIFIIWFLRLCLFRYLAKPNNLLHFSHLCHLAP